ncbi:hypothetical protein ACIGW8_38450 [Streptomyces sioyaensis]|uniref:hypothetical protein n=1 Tax=Streptomyces sioyaensis TaxID=67364 RepID=UPI0037CF4CAD
MKTLKAELTNVAWEERVRSGREPPVGEAELQKAEIAALISGHVNPTGLTDIETGRCVNVVPDPIAEPSPPAA